MEDEREGKQKGCVVLPLMIMETMAATEPCTFSTAELGPCLFVKKKSLLVTDLAGIFSCIKSNILSL